MVHTLIQPAMNNMTGDNIIQLWPSTGLLVCMLEMMFFFIDQKTLFLVAGVQLYNRHFVSVSPSVRTEQFSEPIGVRKLKFGTKKVHTTV